MGKNYVLMKRPGMAKISNNLFTFISGLCFPLRGFWAYAKSNHCEHVCIGWSVKMHDLFGSGDLKSILQSTLIHRVWLVDFLVCISKWKYPIEIFRFKTFPISF